MFTNNLPVTLKSAALFLRATYVIDGVGNILWWFVQHEYWGKSSWFEVMIVSLLWVVGKFTSTRSRLAFKTVFAESPPLAQTKACTHRQENRCFAVSTVTENFQGVAILTHSLFLPSDTPVSVCFQLIDFLAPSLRL